MVNREMAIAPWTKPNLMIALAGSEPSTPSLQQQLLNQWRVALHHAACAIALRSLTMRNGKGPD